MSQKKVKSRYPKACSEQEDHNIWSIWDISRYEREPLSEKHWYRYRSRMLLGLGSTEDEAWANAVREIEWREGRKLPIRKILYIYSKNADMYKSTPVSLPQDDAHETTERMDWLNRMNKTDVGRT